MEAGEKGFLSCEWRKWKYCGSEGLRGCTWIAHFRRQKPQKVLDANDYTAHVKAAVPLTGGRKTSYKSCGKCDIRCRFGGDAATIVDCFCGPFASPKNRWALVHQQKRRPATPLRLQTCFLHVIFYSVCDNNFSPNWRSTNVSSTFFLLSDLTTSTNLVFN